MKIKIIYLFVIAVLLTSCKDKVIRTYYDSGALKTEEFLVDNKDIYSYTKSYYENGTLRVEEYQVKEKEYDLYCKLYYENGNIQGEGPVLENGLLTNCWKYYYSDGSLKWEGEYEDGVRVLFKNGEMPDYDQLEIKLQSVNRRLILGEPYRFRIYVESLLPEDYLLTFNYFHKIEYDESDTANYPYTIPAESIEKIHYLGNDTLYLGLHFPIENGDIIVDSLVKWLVIPIDSVSLH